MLKNAILHSLRHVYVRPVWGLLASLMVRIGGVSVATWLSLRIVDYGTPRPGGTNVLCISRDYFSRDIAELQRRTSLNFVSLLGGYTRFQEPLFPREMRIQTYYQQAAGAPAERAVYQSTEYAKRILCAVSRRARVAAVLSANFDYWQDVGFKHACQSLGIPFLVLSREHITAPNVFDLFVQRQRAANYRFHGAAIAVAGPETYDAIKSVPQLIDTSHVHVTGLPRLDAWLDVDTSVPLAQRPYITLITYTKNYKADDNFVQVVRRFARLARKHRVAGVRFMIKLKNYEDRLDVSRILAKEDTSCLELTYEQPLPELLPRSRLVIGFNSLAIIEAVMARTRLVTPIWGIADNDLKNTMYDLEDEATRRLINPVTSLEELDREVNWSVAGECQMPSASQAIRFASRYFHLAPESTASERVERFILQYIQNLAGDADG